MLARALENDVRQPPQARAGGGAGRALAGVRAALQRPPAIGLDLSQEYLHLVQMAGGGGPPRIRAAVSIPYPEPRDALLAAPARLRALLRAARRGRGFRGTRVVTCIPPESVRLSLVSFRPGAGESDAQALARLAREQLGDAAGESVVDFLPVSTRSEAEGERGALLTVARRAEVIEHVELLRRAGLAVTALEVGPAAIRRLVATLNRLEARENTRNVLVLNCGRRSSYLTVVSGRRLILDREVAFGEAQVLERVARTLEIDLAAAMALMQGHGLPAASSAPVIGAGTEPEDEVAAALLDIVKPALLRLAGEVEKVLIYVASQTRGARIDNAYLLGSLARWPGAGPLLNELLSLPVQVLDPITCFADPAHPPLAAPPPTLSGMALAVGCALREIPADD